MMARYREDAEGDTVGWVGAARVLIVAQRDQAHEGDRPAQGPHPWMVDHSQLHGHHCSEGELPVVCAATAPQGQHPR